MTRRVAGAAVANAGFGALFAWSVVVEAAAADLGVPVGRLSTVWSAALVAFSVGVLSAGPVLRRLGASRLLVAAGALAVAGGAAASAAQSVPALLGGYGVAFGLAAGLGYGAALSVGASAPPPRRGLALGVIVAAFAATPIVLGPVGVRLVEGAGWRITVAAVGAVVAPAALAGAALARGAPRPLPRDGRPPARHSLGLEALLWFAFAGGTVAALFAFGVAADLALARGGGSTAAGGAVAALAAGNLGGRLAGGWLADRVREIRALGASTAMAVAGSVAAVPGGGIWPLLAALGLLGLGYGAQSAVLPAATTRVVGAARFASSYGRVFTSWGAAGLVGPLAGAWLWDVGGDALVFGAGAAAAALGGVAVGLLASRVPR